MEAVDASAIRIAQVVLQPTSFCNLNCTYCYVPNRLDRSRMSESTLETAISKVLRSSWVRDEIEFLWHAGEPLAAGRAHYQMAAALIEQYADRSTVIHRSIQTNGTLIDDAWCDLFLEHAIAIGLSVDGPAFLHDANRRNWAGHASHEKVMAGYETLVRHGIGPGAICVLTRDSLRFPDEIFGFFVDHGFKSVAFNVEEVENVHRDSSLTSDGSHLVREEYERFIARIYDLWASDPATIAIREFSQLLSVIGEKLRDKDYSRVPLETQPLAIVTIQKNGDISTYSPEFAGGQSPRFSNFVIGNIHRIENLEDVMLSPVLEAMGEEISRGIAACAETCDFFDLCGGGYTSNKFFENGSLSSTETTACRLHRQALSSVLIDKLSSAVA